jgi:prepilin peptidase CpaA
MWYLLTITLTGFALAGAASDVRDRRIPNRLVLTGLAIALALRAVAGFEPLWHGVAGGLVALGISFPFFLMRAFGGGDVKFLTASGAFVGLPLIGMTMLVAAAVGGLVAVVVAFRSRLPLVVALRTWQLAQNAITAGSAGERTTLQHEHAVTAPFGVAIAAGALIAWFGTAAGWA